VYYFFFYPDTTGNALEQMDEVFENQIVPHPIEGPAGADLAKGDLSAAGAEKV